MRGIKTTMAGTLAGLLLVPTVAGFAQQGAKPVTAGWGKEVDQLQAEPFRGEHQAGIVTKPQHFIYFATFDLTTSRREDLVRLLKAWTEASERMSLGESAQPMESGLKLAVPLPAPKAGEEAAVNDPASRAADTGEVLGMPPARLTLTFGFGPSLFNKDGVDRFGLARFRPEALVDMPNFGSIDQMAPEKTGGDIAVQACAEDPQVAFHAIRQLARIAEGIATIRWVQTGYRPIVGDRHLLGFSAEEKVPGMNSPEANAVWVGHEGPDWMRGGSYLVARRVRFAIEHWDQMPQVYQEAAIGAMKHEHPKAAPTAQNSADGDFVDEGGSPAHLALVTGGRDAMLRRSYSYNDGVNFISERWPPWRQGLEYDAGMFFLCFQHDPRTGFIPVFRQMANRDYRLNQFWTHVGGGLYAVPRGIQPGEYIGQKLMEEK